MSSSKAKLGEVPRMIDALAAESSDLQQLLEKVDVKGIETGGLIEAVVSLNTIYREDVPVDASHVEEIRRSIQAEADLRGGTGQLSPVLLAHVPDFGQFLIIDGFHRVATFAQAGSGESLSSENGLRARIRPNTSLEEVTDLRILTANTHKAVKFSRVVEWVEEAWSRTPWADQINAAQAFTLVFVKTMTGQRIGISAKEADQIRDWVDRKSDQWRLSPHSVYQYLSVARVADPALVKEARERRSGRQLESITLQHLKVIAKAFPFQYDFQQLAAKVAKSSNLTVPRTRGLVGALAGTGNIESATKIAESGSWTNLEPVYSPSHAREIRRQRRTFGTAPEETTSYDEELLEDLFEAEMEIGRLCIENAILSGRFSLGEDFEPVDALEADIEEETEEMNDPELDLLLATEDLNPQRQSVWTNEQVSAFLSVFETRKRDLATYLSRRFSGFNSQDIEDVIQDASLRIFMATTTGGLRDKFIGADEDRDKFVFVSTKWVAIELDRKRSGRKGLSAKPTVVSIDETSAQTDTDQPPRAIRRALSDTDEGYEEVEERLSHAYLDYVKTMLPKLKPEHRRMLVLKAFFNLPMHAVGLITGVTESRVSQVMTEVRDKLIENAPRKLARETISIPATIITKEQIDRTVNKSQTVLSPSEATQLAYAASGYGSIEAAGTQWLSMETVKKHKSNAIEKLGARNTAHAVRLAYEKGILLPLSVEEQLQTYGDLDATKVSPAELKTLQLLSDGLSNDAIAQETGVSPETVKSRVLTILKKLGASNRVQAIRIALETGIVELG